MHASPVETECLPVRTWPPRRHEHTAAVAGERAGRRKNRAFLKQTPNASADTWSLAGNQISNSGQALKPYAAAQAGSSLHMKSRPRVHILLQSTGDFATRENVHFLKSI